MKQSNRALFCFGLASAVFSACAVIVGMTNSVAGPKVKTTRTDQASTRASSSKALEAKDSPQPSLLKQSEPLLENSKKRILETSTSKPSFQRHVWINDDGMSVEAAIEHMDNYYQALFMDKELAFQGVFGANRLISSKIDAHGGKDTDPAYRMKEIKSQVIVFGNKGKSLNPATISQRYKRLANSIDYESLMPGQKESDRKRIPDPDFEIDSLIKAAAKKSLEGQGGPFTHESNGWTLQIRRVNLSKSECLPCHKDMKIGDPVALMAYLAIKAPATR